MSQTLIGFIRGVEIFVYAKETSTPGLKPSWSLEAGYQSGGWLESLCEAEMQFSVNLWTPGRWQIYSTFRPGSAIRALLKEIKLPKLTVLCSSQHIVLQLKAWCEQDIWCFLCVRKTSVKIQTVHVCVLCNPVILQGPTDGSNVPHISNDVAHLIDRSFNNMSHVFYSQYSVFLQAFCIHLL